MELKRPSLPQIDYFKHYSTLEKIFLLYTILLIILMIALPIFKTWSLSSTQSISYNFFNMSMIKTNILVVMILGLMIGWNMSSNFRQKIYDLVWFRSSDALVNFVCLFALILMLFGIWDTVWAITSSFSQRLSTTSGYLILLLYLIAWLILTWYIAYTTNSAQTPVQNNERIDVPHEDDIRNTEAFKKVEQEFEGLFKEERAAPTTLPEQPRPSQSSDYLR